MKLFKLVIIVLFAMILLGFNQAFAAYQPKWIVLKVNGKEYSSKNADNSKRQIIVKPGQTIGITAKFMGGLRNFCLNPPPSTELSIVSKNENGLVRFHAKRNIREEYKLISEEVSIGNHRGIKVLSVDGPNASIKIPETDIQYAHMQVIISTKWEYTGTNTKTNKVTLNRITPQSTGATFYFKVGNPESGVKPNSDPDPDNNDRVWFTSENIVVKGTENNSLRTKFNDLQNYLNDISNNLVNKKFTLVNSQLSNLILTMASIDSYIKNLKSKNPEFKCNVTFTGVPSSKAMKNVANLEESKAKLKELAMIAQGNHNKINEMLSGTQNVFSANILKSVFKNYLNWSGSLPTDATAGLASYSTNTGLADLPRTFTSWYDDAKSDSNVLRNQARKIKALTDLREFYVAKQEKAVADRKKVNEELITLQPQVLKRVDNQLKTYFSSLGWAKWKASAN